MRINESYPHEPLLNGKGEESPRETGCTCERTGRQCVDVTASVDVRPKVQMGRVSICCQGDPVVDCVTSADGSHCTVTFTQKLCFTLPLCYGLEFTEEDPTIACAYSTAVTPAPHCGCGEMESPKA